MDLLRKLWQQSHSTDKIIDRSEVEYIRDVIDSCLTFEQLMITDQWIDRIWDDPEMVLMARARISAREKDIGTATPGATIDKGTLRYH